MNLNESTIHSLKNFRNLLILEIDPQLVVNQLRVPCVAFPSYRNLRLDSSSSTSPQAQPVGLPHHPPLHPLPPPTPRKHLHVQAEVPIAQPVTEQMVLILSLL